MLTNFRTRYPKQEAETVLRYAIKGLNDTTRRNGYVLLMLVFISMSTFLICNKGIPGQQDRMESLRTARRKIASIQTAHELRLAINHNVPPSEHYKLRSGENLYAYSE